MTKKIDDTNEIVLKDSAYENLIASASGDDILSDNKKKMSAENIGAKKDLQKSSAIKSNAKDCKPTKIVEEKNDLQKSSAIKSNAKDCKPTKIVEAKNDLQNSSAEKVNVDNEVKTPFVGYDTTISKSKNIFNIMKFDFKNESKNLKKPMSLFVISLAFVILFFAMAVFNSNSTYYTMVAKQEYIYQNSIMINGAYAGLDNEKIIAEQLPNNAINFVRKNEQLLNLDNRALIELDVIYFDKMLPEGKLKISDAIIDRLQEKNAKIIKDDKKNNVEVPSKLFDDKIAVGEKFKVFGEVFEVEEVVKTNYENEKKFNKFNTYEFDFIYLPQSYFEKLSAVKNVVLQLIDGDKNRAVEVLVDENLDDTVVNVSSDIFTFFEGNKQVLFDRGSKGKFSFQNKTFNSVQTSGNKIWVSKAEYSHLKKVVSNSFFALNGPLEKSEIKELNEKNAITLNNSGFSKYYELQSGNAKIREDKVLNILGVVGCIVSLSLAVYFGYLLCKKYFDGKSESIEKLNIKDENANFSKQLIWYECLALVIVSLLFALINFVVFWFIACYVYGIVVFSGAKILMFLPILFGIGIAIAIIGGCFAYKMLIKKDKNTIKNNKQSTETN